MVNFSLSTFFELLDEVYVGSNGSPSWVIDRKPGYGFLGVLNTVNAQQASTPVVPEGSTVAGHAEHLRWSLQFALEFLEGRVPDVDWSKSWTVKKVNDQEWTALQKRLTDACKKIREALFSNREYTDPTMTKGILALLPHAAYHLGAIKQILLVVKSRKA